MLSEKMQAALNGQLNAEFYSAYLYLSMSAYFQSINLGGFANWTRIQAQEELLHSMKFFDYINDRAGRITLASIEEPPAKWDSPMAVFEYGYKHEQKVSSLINDLVNLAIDDKDHATNNFLQWFVSEQVEEEASFNDVLQKLGVMGDAAGGLFMFDREMAQRVFTMPATTE